VDGIKQAPIEDVAAKNPEKVQELKAIFLKEAEKYQVRRADPAAVEVECCLVLRNVLPLPKVCD
jgi:hypothetical protein